MSRPPRPASMFEPRMTLWRGLALGALILAVLGPLAALSTRGLLESKFYAPVLGQIVHDARVAAALGEPVKAARYPLVERFETGAAGVQASFDLWLSGSQHQGWARCDVRQRPGHRDESIVVHAAGRVIVLAKFAPSPEPTPFNMLDIKGGKAPP